MSSDKKVTHAKGKNDPNYKIILDHISKYILNSQDLVICDEYILRSEQKNNYTLNEKLIHQAKLQVIANHPDKILFSDFIKFDSYTKSLSSFGQDHSFLIEWWNSNNEIEIKLYDYESK